MYTFSARADRKTNGGPQGPSRGTGAAVGNPTGRWSDQTSPGEHTPGVATVTGGRAQIQSNSSDSAGRSC